jgi:hypothetical protein
VDCATVHDARLKFSTHVPYSFRLLYPRLFF